MISIDVSKKLHGVNGLMNLEILLQIKRGDFIALSGISGSGKTKLLRILAGLENAEGSIEVDGEVWLGKNHFLKVQERRIGFVFQDYALFENMNVEQNLLYVEKDKDLCEKLLKMTGLSELRKRLPSSLSGGQKQRVSLCRAMMNKPKLLLMDEPFSALDFAMRLKLQSEILALHKEFGTTTIMVSHEPSEMYRLASRVIVLENGKIVKDAKPRDIFFTTKDSKKLSFEGELLEVMRENSGYIAVIAIGQQIVELVISKDESQTLKIGQKVNISTKVFSQIIG